MHYLIVTKETSRPYGLSLVFYVMDYFFSREATFTYLFTYDIHLSFNSYPHKYTYVTLDYVKRLQS
jgi:hypothetical protein